MRTVIKWISIALGLLIVGMVILVVLFDGNWLKGYVARQASAALGRTVVIEGDLDIELSWTPLVHIDHIRVANASWSPEPHMLTLQRLTFRLDLRQLLQTFSGAFGPPAPLAAAETPGKDALSETLIDLELTRVVNAQLHFEAQTVMMTNQTVHNVSADLALHDGHLVLTPVFRLAGGTTRAQIKLEDRGEAPLHMAIRADMTHVNVQHVLAALGIEYKVTGSVDGHMDLATSGRSLPQLLSSLTGKAAFTVRDQATNTDVQVHVTTEGGTQSTPPRLRLASQGRMRGEPFHLEGRLGAWGREQQPSPLQVRLRLGETRARLDGTLTQGPQRTGLAAQVAMQGPDPARLSALLPLSIPSLPAYRVEGRLLHQGSTWTLKELKGVIGDSDLAGELSLDTDGKHLVLHGDLHSQIFVVDELTGYAPEKKPGRVEPEKIQVPAQVQEQVQEHPQAIDVTVRFRSNKVIVAKVPLEHFATDLQLHNDRLALTPTFHLAGGTVRAQTQIETQANPLQSTIHITMHQLHVQQLLAWLELRPEDAAKLTTAGKREATAKPEATGKPAMASKPEAAGKLGTAGKLDGQIALTGTGRSLADFLASANGNVLLSMVEGQLGKVLIELVGLDVAETIEKALARGKAYQLRCLVADFAVHNGIMETQMLLIDTTDTKVIGGGGHRSTRQNAWAEAGAKGQRLQSVFGAGAIIHHRPLGHTCCRPQARRNAAVLEHAD